MRFTRIITGIIALAMTAFLSLAVSSSTASAEPQEAKSSASNEGSDTTNKAQAVKRSVTLNFISKGRRFNYSGKVGPKGGNLRINLKYAKAKKGNYKTVRKVKTRANGRYGFNGLSNLGWYKVVVPPSRGYQSSSSRLSHIVRQ